MSILFAPSKTTFNIPTGHANVTIPVNIATPDLRAENLPLSTWTASVILAGQLHNFDFFPATSSGTEDESLAIPILELGAGTGLVGLSATMLWKKPAILTDLAPIVPGLDANIALNQAHIAESGGRAACGSLDWSAPAALTLACAAGVQRIASSRKARVILAADTVYDLHHPELMQNAIFAWLERSAQARLCICYPLRVAYLDEIRELWRRLEAGGLECVQEGTERFAGKSPNGDDEALCEWCVWRWRGLGELSDALEIVELEKR